MVVGGAPEKNDSHVRDIALGRRFLKCHRISQFYRIHFHSCPEFPR